MVGLRPEVAQYPPDQVGEGVGAEDESVGNVWEDIDQEVLQRMAVVRGQCEGSSPLVVDLVDVAVESPVVSQSVAAVEQDLVHHCEAEDVETNVPVGRQCQV